MSSKEKFISIEEEIPIKMGLYQFKEGSMKSDNIEFEKSENRMTPFNNEREIQGDIYSTGSITPNAKSGDINQLLSFTQPLSKLIIIKNPLEA